MQFPKAILNFFSIGDQRPDLFMKILRWILRFTVCIIPIFFLWPSSSPIELNKTLLFVIVISFLAVLFLIRALIRRTIAITLTRLEWYMAVLLLFYILAFIFSVNHYASLVGMGGGYSYGIITTVCFILFFYLVIQSIRTAKDVWWYIVVFGVASFLVITYNLFAAFGLYWFPWEITHSGLFNLVGSSSVVLSVFSGFCVLLGMGLLLRAKKIWRRLGGGIYLVAALGLLFILDKPLVLFAAMAVVFIFLIVVALRSGLADKWWPIVPTVIIILLVTMMFMNSHELFSIKVSDSINIDQKTSAHVAWQTFVESPFTGSGPQTFLYDFAEFRPAAFNQTDFWNVRFSKASNVWLELLATTGVGATAAFFLLVVAIVAIHFRTIIKQKKQDKQWGMLAVLLFGCIYLLALSFFVAFNFIILFIWWLFLAVSLKMGMLIKDTSVKKQYRLRDKKRWLIGIGATTAVVLGLALVIFFGSKVWIADYHYAAAQEQIAQQNDISVIQDRLQTAIRLNPYDYRYYALLAQSYAIQAQLLIERGDGQATDLQQYSQQVIDQLENMESADPKNPLVYEEQGKLYDSLRNIIANVDELSVESYNKQAGLEPNNPLVYLNLGRSQWLWARQLQNQESSQSQQSEIEKLATGAVTNFQKAKALKTDYYIADYNTGLIYSWNGQYETALSYFQKVIDGMPQAIEAYWQRAGIFEEQGEIDMALNELNTILQYDPDNSTVLEKITDLKKGTTGI